MTPIDQTDTHQPDIHRPTVRKARSTTISRRLLALGAAATVALSAGACSTAPSKKADAKSEVGSALVADSSKPADSSTSPARGSTTTGSGPTTTSAPNAGDDRTVLGSSRGQHPADPNDGTPVPLRLDVRSVKRLSGETIEVRFDITNTGTGATFEPWRELGDPTIGGGSAYDVGGVALLDRPHDKKYLTLYGTDKVCLCSGSLSAVDIAPGKTASMYADVTAPPESVTTVDLSVPGFAPINGLKIR